MPPSRRISPGTIVALVAGFLLLRAALFAFTTNGEYVLYERYADAARSTSLSELYRTKDVEYPPLAVLFGVPAAELADVLPPWTARLVAWRPNPVIGENGPRYQVALGIVLFAVDLACLALVYVITRRVYPEEGPWKRVGRLAVYVAATTAGGLILYDRQDLIVGLIPLVAIAAFVRGWSGVAYAVLTVGTAYKLVPLLLFPLFVFAFAASRSAPTSTRGFLVALVKQSAVAGLILAMYPLLSYLLWGPRSFLFLTFHSARGLQLEAPVTWLVFLLDPATEVGYGYGSHTLNGRLCNRVAALAGPVMALVAVFTVLISARGFWRIATAKQPADGNALATHLVVSSLLVWLGFILFNKVGSPQYLLWLTPLVPLVPLRSSWRGCIGVLILGMVVTAVIFPGQHHHVRGEFTDDPFVWAGPTTFGLILLAAKSITLTVSFVWLAVLTWRAGGVRDGLSE